MIQAEYKDLDKFQSFGKIPRYSRGIVITEKLDGTNAQIVITPNGEMLAGSRNQYITPEHDNFGFAAWVKQNKDELMKLGVGRHYGEWWGLGIQRGYGLFERRFSLFNTARWSHPESRPNCCGVVPLLAYGDFTDSLIFSALNELKEGGSKAAPGYLKPEGIVIYHKASNSLFKKTIENDEIAKGEVNNEERAVQQKAS